jgi:hypothetical protein
VAHTVAYSPVIVPLLCTQVGELHSTKGDLEVQLEDLRLENDHLVRPELDRLRDLKVIISNNTGIAKLQAVHLLTVCVYTHL